MKAQRQQCTKTKLGVGAELLGLEKKVSRVSFFDPETYS